MEETMSISGLVGKDRKLDTKGEMDVQNEWRKNGDWKAGSVPFDPRHDVGEDISSNSMGSSGAKCNSRSLHRETLGLLAPRSRPQAQTLRLRPEVIIQPRLRRLGFRTKDISVFIPPKLTRQDAVEGKDFPCTLWSISEDFYLHQIGKRNSQIGQ